MFIMALLMCTCDGTMQISLVGNDSSKYAIFRFRGQMIKEESESLSGFTRPEKPIVIYEFESCPYCRKVREAIAVLDLDALILPCPKGLGGLDGLVDFQERQSESKKGC